MTEKLPKFIVKARNILTGKIVELPMTTKEEEKQFKWYPKTEYAPLEIRPPTKRRKRK